MTQELQDQLLEVWEEARTKSVQGGIDYSFDSLLSLVDEVRTAAYETGYRDGQQSTKPVSLGQLLEDNGI